MSYEISSFDTRKRVVAMQATAHACAAAAVADVVADLIGVTTGVGIGQIQQDLISDLGGLTDQGTTLERVATCAWRRYHKSLMVYQPFRRTWEGALNLVGATGGVVVGLAPPSGQGEGHAVRLLGSSRPLRQPDEDPFIADLVHPPAFSAAFHMVQYFDPDPRRPRGAHGPVFFEPHGVLRPRFERFPGNRVLCIERKNAV